MATLQLIPDTRKAYSASVMSGGVTRPMGMIGGKEVAELSDETDREGGGWVTRFIFDGQRVEVEDSVVSTELFVRFCIAEQRAPDAEVLAECETKVARELEKAESDIRAAITRHQETCQLAEQFLAKLATDRPDLAEEATAVAKQVSACACRAANFGEARRQVWARYGVQLY
jgi:hypothetical protein